MKLARTLLRSPLSTSIAALLGLMSQDAGAATLTWQTAGATNAWSTAAGDTNWFVDGIAPLAQWTDGNAAIFDAATGEAVTLTGTVAPTSTTINNNGTWSFTGTGVMAGTGTTLVKNGTGILTLANTAANTFTGGTTINGGTLAIGTGGTAGPTSTVSALGTGGVTVNSTGTLKLWIQNNATFTIANAITLNGGSILNEDGNHTLSGPVTLDAGGGRFGAQWTAKNLTVSGVISGAGVLTVEGYGGGSGAAATQVTLTNLNTNSGGTIVNAGTLALSNGGSTGVLRGTVTVNTGGTLQLNNANALGYGAGTKVNTVNLAGGTLNNSGGGDNGWGVTYNLTGGTLRSNAGTSSATAAQLFSFGSNTVVNSLASANTSVVAGRVHIREGNTGNTVLFDVANGAAATDLLVSAAITEGAAGYGITKNNNGLLLFTGAGSYTGATVINGGTFVLGATGTLGGTAVTVNNTAALRVETTGKTLSSLTANNGSTLGLQALAGSTTTVTGALNLANGAAINIELQGIQPGAQVGNVIDLITAGSVTGTGTTTVLTTTPYGPTRVAGTTAVAGNKLQLTLTSAAANLVWNNAAGGGAATGSWDLDTTANFNNSGSNDVFKAFDGVTFDDTVQNGTAKTVNLTGNLAPSIITANNSAGDYTLASTGALVGSGALVKSGSSALILSNTGGYAMTGNITVNGGTLDLRANNLALAPSSTIAVNGGSLIVGAGGTSGSLGATPVTVQAGASLVFNRSDNAVPAIANNFSGAGLLNFTGTNNGTTNQQSGYSLSGNNSGFSGTINSTNSRVGLDNANDVGTAALTTGVNGQFFITAGTYANTFTIAGNGWGEAAGVLGAIRISNATLTGTINLSGDARIATHGGTATIAGPIAGGFGVTFGGTSAATNLTLSGTSTYTGATAIGTNATNTAAITLTGGLGATAVTVNPGSTLSGKGSIGNGGSLTFATGATNFGFDARTAGAMSVGGNVNFAGTTTVNLTPGAAITPGSPITLLTYTGTASGGVPNLALATPANYRQAVFGIGAGAVTLDIGAKALVWTGTGGLTWTTGGATSNWNDTTPAASTFFHGDTVVFNDNAGAANGTVTLGGTVAPSSIVVNSVTVPYAINGSAGNLIGGGAALLKDGASTLKINAPNTFTGGTTISEGTVESLNATSLGSGTIRLGDANTGTAATALYLDTNRQVIANQVIVTSNGTGTATLGSRATVGGTGATNTFSNIVLQRNVTFDSNAADRTDYNTISGTGDIRITGTGRTLWATANTFTGNITVATTGAGSFQPFAANAIPDTSDITVESGAVINFGTSDAFDALNGSGTVSTNTGANGTFTATLGAGNGSGDFDGTLQNNSATQILAVTKAGTGLQIIGGTGLYTGPTIVNGGTLLVEGTLSGTASVAVNSTGTLQLGGDSVLNTAATVSLGGGTFDTDGFNQTLGVLSLTANSVLRLGDGSSTLNFAKSASLWSAGTIFTISEWSGLAVGGGADRVFFGTDATGLGANLAAIRFLNPEGFAPGVYTADILSTGEIVAIPEPGSMALLIGGLGFLASARRRGRNE